MLKVIESSRDPKVSFRLQSHTNFNATLPSSSSFENYNLYESYPTSDIILASLIRPSLSHTPLIMHFPRTQRHVLPSPPATPGPLSVHQRSPCTNARAPLNFDVVTSLSLRHNAQLHKMTSLTIYSTAPAAVLKFVGYHVNFSSDTCGPQRSVAANFLLSRHCGISWRIRSGCGDLRFCQEFENSLVFVAVCSCTIQGHFSFGRNLTKRWGESM